MALLPPSDLDSVVSIGTQEGEKFRPLATGFLVGFLTGEKNDKGEQLYRIFLVTNRHVFVGKREVLLRFNLSEKGSRIYNLVLEDDSGRRWTPHPNEKVDIAVIPINVRLLEKDEIKFSFLPEDRMAFLETIRREGISQGDGVFVLGFPMGLAGEEKNFVVVRNGIIARLDDEIVNREFYFLIDSMVYPGNSGGPVILKPELAGIEGTKAVNRAYLLGVVSRYMPYREIAVSPQTGEPRIIFMENSGLAGVVPMDFVKETVKPLMPLQTANRVGT
jgi:S1-C subfamily serine protease